MKKHLPSKWSALSLLAVALSARAAEPLSTPALPGAPERPAEIAPAGQRSGFAQVDVGGLTAKGSVLLQADSRAFAANPKLASPDQFLFRRAQPGVTGTIQRNFDFRVLTDVAGGKFTLLDTYVDVRYVPFAKVRVGKFKSPLGLEFLQSSSALVLAERSFPTALSPGYDVGVQLFGDLGDVASYAVAAVDGAADGSDAEGDLSNGKDVVARLFVRPFAPSAWAALKGLGVGVAGSNGLAKGTVDGTEVPSFKSDGRNTIFKYLSATDASGKVDLTKSAVADGAHTRWALQGNYYFGPLGLQAEYVRSTQKIRNGSLEAKPANWAWQAAGSFVLGGNASYKGVTPKAAFDPAAGGWGALEVAARYAELKLDGTLFAGGAFASEGSSVRRARLVSPGVSWYLNDNLRVSVDYARTQFTAGAKDASGRVVDRAAEQVVVSRVQFAL